MVARFRNPRIRLSTKWSNEATAAASLLDSFPRYGYQEQWRPPGRYLIRGGAYDSFYRVEEILAAISAARLHVRLMRGYRGEVRRPILGPIDKISPDSKLGIRSHNDPKLFTDGAIADSTNEEENRWRWTLSNSENS